MTPLTSLTLSLAHFLWALALVAGSCAATGLILVNLPRSKALSLTRRAALAMSRLGTLKPGHSARPGRTPGLRNRRVTRPAGRDGKAAVVTATVPVFASRGRGPADKLADLHGVGRLAARARASRWQCGARGLAVLQIRSLEDHADSPDAPERYLEFELLLGGEVLAATLLTTSGVFVVVVHDRDPNDAGSLLSLGPRLARHEDALSQLRGLLGVEPEVLVYSPYGDARAQMAYVGRPLVTVAGPSALEALLRERHGRGLTSEEIARIRDTDVPGSFARQVKVSEHTMGARRAATAQIETLSGAERVIERHLELGGVVVPVTLLTTSGVFIVIVRDQLAADVPTFVALCQSVADHAQSQIELAQLLPGVEPEIVVYCPGADEPARSDYVGRRVFTVGGAAALDALLDERPSGGLTREALALFRAAAKPYGRISSDVVAHAAGRDSSDLAHS